MKRGEVIGQGAILEVVKRSGGRCEAGLPYCCAYIAGEIHHRKSRARGGSNAAINLVHVCRPCHRAITDHKDMTEKFRTHSWQDEGETEADRPRSWRP